jgi:AraC-like DNA-binding protein
MKMTEPPFATSKCLLPAVAACGCVHARLPAPEAPAPEGGCELHLIVEGQWRAWRHDAPLACGPGDLLAVAPGTDIRLLSTHRRRGVRYWIRLAAGSADDLLAELAAGPSLARAHSLTTLFALLLAEHRQPQSDSAAYLQALFPALLFAIRREQQRAREGAAAPGQPRVSAWGRRVMALLGEQVGAPEVGLMAVAEQLGLGERELRGRFLAEVGYTPAQYLTQLRVQAAQQRLAESPQRVTQIAFDLGFSSSQYFATFFRKHVGQSPAEYRSGRQHAPRPSGPA